MEEQLLSRLHERVNPRGIVPVRGEVLAAEVSATPEELTTALRKMERAGLLTILAPLPFLVLRLRMWPGHNPKGPSSALVAYGSSSQSTIPLKESYRPDAPLLREILDTLGESDAHSFEGAIRHFAPEIIRKALDRVRRAKSLRKNRTALFRYLLTKLS